MFRLWISINLQKSFRNDCSYTSAKLLDDGHFAVCDRADVALDFVGCAKLAGMHSS